MRTDVHMMIGQSNVVSPAIVVSIKSQLNKLWLEPTFSPKPYFKSYVKRADVGKKMMAAIKCRMEAEKSFKISSTVRYFHQK